MQRFRPEYSGQRIYSIHKDVIRDLKIIKILCSLCDLCGKNIIRKSTGGRVAPPIPLIGIGGVTQYQNNNKISKFAKV